MGVHGGSGRHNQSESKRHTSNPLFRELHRHFVTFIQLGAVVNIRRSVNGFVASCCSWISTVEVILLD